jgi:hypothetical protein
VAAPAFPRYQRDQAEWPAPNFAANWNVAPTDPLPFWAKDIKVGFANINEVEFVSLWRDLP